MLILGQIILLSCIPFTLLCFLQMPPRRALLFSMIACWLVVPTMTYVLPGVPDYSKYSAPPFAALLGVLLLDLRRVLRGRPRWFDLPVFVYCLAPIFTAVSNDLGVYEGFSWSLEHLVQWGVPYLLGRLYLNDLESIKAFAVAIVLGGLAYVLPCLWEVRMSPNLVTIFYGLPPNVWEAPRFGLGYRPIVFMVTGLETGLWMTVATLCGYWLWATGSIREMNGFQFGALLIALAVTGILCKSVGAILLLGLGILVLQLSWRLKTAIPVLVLMALAPAHMITRTTGIWSGRETIDLTASAINSDRAGSMQTRVESENLLIGKALRRPILGWGRFNRSQESWATPDGYWIITFGTMGYVGLVSQTLIFLLPVSRLIRRYPIKLWSNPEVAAAAVVAVVVINYLIDCLANAMLNPIYILGMGGLASLASEPQGYEGDQCAAMGDHLRRSGRLDQAESAYRRALALYALDRPKDPRILKGLTLTCESLSDLLLETDRPDEALHQLSEALRHRERWSVLSGDTLGALSALSNGYERLARLFLSLGHPDASKAAWNHVLSLTEKAVLIDPNNLALAQQWANALNDFAWQLAVAMAPADRDPAAGVELVTKAIERISEQPDYWNTLGACLYYSGDYPGAVDAVNRSVELRQEETISDHFLRALAYARLGEMELAADELRLGERVASGQSMGLNAASRLHEDAQALLGLTVPAGGPPEEA